MKKINYIGMILILTLWSLASSATPGDVVKRGRSHVRGQRCAIVLHGLARTSRSMRSIQRALENEGYLVWNKTYPSTQKRIEELALVINEALAYCAEHQSTGIYFVTHSMGGILVRQYFQSHSTRHVNAIVMLAPPNHGSEIVDAHGDSAWFQWYHGPAGNQLGTGSQSLPLRLRPINAPIGVIAGTVSSDPWFGYLFKGLYDGKVSVESARLEEMRDFLTVARGHTRIMDSTEVIEQVLYFFEHLQFNK